MHKGPLNVCGSTDGNKSPETTKKELIIILIKKRLHTTHVALLCSLYEATSYMRSVFVSLPIYLRKGTKQKYEYVP